MTTALVADDERLLREQLRARLGEVWPELEIVAEAKNGAEAVALTEHHHPDVVFLDIRMPGMSGLELQSRLHKEHHRVPIIFITAQGDEKMRMQALRAGAVEFLTKPFDDEVLLDSVRAALNS